jgi:PRTRC genetic system ThiF family protein
MDLSYVEAYKVLPYQARSIRIIVVGLGGTGSFLARHVAVLASLLQRAGKEVTLIFVDPDRVEEANIPRQDFCYAERGRYKAQTLAERFSAALGVNISFIPDVFSPAIVGPSWEALTILVGCVDRAEGRVAMGEALQVNRRHLACGQAPRVWYLDLGNGLDYGQCLLGCLDTVDLLERAFSFSAFYGCISLLPSPLLLEPKLKEPRPEEAEVHALSCAELLAANAQSLMINPFIANVAASYLYEMLITGTLKRFRTDLDLPSGTMRSRYTTPEALGKAIGCDASFFQVRTA